MVLRQDVLLKPTAKCHRTSSSGGRCDSATRRTRGSPSTARSTPRLGRHSADRVETRCVARRTVTMLDRGFPRSIDNNYRGHKLAFVPFALLVLMKLVIGVNSIFRGY